MADDPWAVVSTKPIAATPPPAASSAPPASPVPTDDPWAVVQTKPAATASPIPTVTVKPAAAPRPDQSGDLLTQPRTQQGDFYSSAAMAPEKYHSMLQAAADKYGVPINVLNWVGYHESGWNPAAVGMQTSSGRAKGLFQFMDGTAKGMGIDPMDPAQAIDGAARYLRQLADRHGGDWTQALQSYGVFSTGMGSQRDAAAKAGFEQYLGKGGAAQSGRSTTDAGASSMERSLMRSTQAAPGDDAPDKYEGWDTPEGPVDNKDPEYVPFRDEPGTVRGNILPIMRDKDGNYSWAVPDMLRAPFRGVIEGGQEARGVRPVDDPRARGDIAAAAGTFLGGVRPTAGNFTTPAQRAAAEATAAEQAMQRSNAAVADNILGYGRTPEGKAAKLLGKRANQDVQSGSHYNPETDYQVPQRQSTMPPLALNTGPADEIVGQMNRMRESGKPANIVHAAGPNVTGLAGKLSRQPGVAQGIIRQGLKEVDAGAADRNLADVGKLLRKGSSAYRTVVDLLKKRSEESKPLYEKALQGGSIAPLETQLQNEWNLASRAAQQANQDLEVARSQLNAALGRQPVTRGMDYSDSFANAEVREAKARVAAAEARASTASLDAEEVKATMQRAQQDRANNAPGAVWNLRIQRLLDRPKLKEGIRLGMTIQADEAASNGTRFDPMEYALTDEGEVIRVPNMRTLNIAKKGLDRMYSDTLDEFGRPNEAGVAIDMMRRSLLREMDAINPDYKIARNAWAESSQSLDAVKWGKGLKKLSPEQVAQEFSDMTPSEQEFARLSVADGLLHTIGETALGADEAKNLLKNQNMRDRVQPIFRTQDEFISYLEAVADERRMYDVKTRVLGNSETAARQMEDGSQDLSVAGHLAHGASNVAHGHLLRAASSFFRGAREWLHRPNPQMDEALARQMMDPKLTPNVVNGRLDFTPPVPPIQTPTGPMSPQ